MRKLMLAAAILAASLPAFADGPAGRTHKPRTVADLMAAEPPLAERRKECLESIPGAIARARAATSYADLARSVVGIGYRPALMTSYAAEDIYVKQMSDQEVRASLTDVCLNLRDYQAARD